MALRVFRSGDGQEWNVWHVRPTTGDDSPLNSRFREGWLCFKRVDGEERSRMPIGEAPADWESLSDERLDLLRRVADQPLAVRSAVGPTEERRQSHVEDVQQRRASGQAPAGSADELV